MILSTLFLALLAGSGAEPAATSPDRPARGPAPADDVDAVELGALPADPQDRDAGEDASVEPAASVAEALRPLARVMDGEWRILFRPGIWQVDTWSWGPGGRSAIAWTHGTDAVGRPWRGVTVAYPAPEGEGVRHLHLSPHVPAVGRGVGVGTLRFGAQAWVTAFGLWQPATRSRARDMELRWHFPGPDAIRLSLLERTGGGGMEALAEWDYHRSRAFTPPPVPHFVPAEPDSNPLREPLEQHLGPAARRTWTGALAGEAGEDRELRATVTWIPYVGAAHARVVALDPDGGEPDLRLEAFLYHHPTRGGLHALVLTDAGPALAGEARWLEGGALGLDLASDGESDARRSSVRLGPGDGGAWRVRAWVGDAESRGADDGGPRIDLSLEPLLPESGAPADR